MDSTEGKMSSIIILLSLVELSFVIPGHFTINGIRIPPS